MQYLCKPLRHIKNDVVAAGDLVGAPPLLWTDTSVSAERFERDPCLK
jgi:hypothetical protein